MKRNLQILGYLFLIALSCLVIAGCIAIGVHHHLRKQAAIDRILNLP